MTIAVESVEEFQRLCKRVVSDNMLRLSVEDEQEVVALMLQCFLYGQQFEQDGKVRINV